MPHVNVKLWPGKTTEQKQALADAIAKNVREIMGSSDASISVSIEDVASEVWAEDVYKPEIVGRPDVLFKKPGYSM